ncbi:MAG TPA: DUF924 family protein [Methylomirabilota bacterium]|nr:DUF924 family protein [Methylomirabilota bacterium]
MTEFPAETPTDVLKFWWAAGPAAWFRSDPAFDERVRAVLRPLAAHARNGGLRDWEDTPHGTLALTILLDQVPRNIHRGSKEAFASDPLALEVARRALAAGYPDAYPPQARAFFYLPFEHAEDLEAQALSVDMFRTLGDKEYTLYALMHFEAIARFGRFPHRNAILGRVSTEAELAFLAAGGFSA